MHSDLAPVILFIYNRPNHTRRTLEALQRNTEAAGSILYVFADGAKENANPADLALIKQAREVITGQNWCKETFLTVRENNMALEDNVIDGITQVINKHGKAIILEDDIEVSPWFLKYCNDGLKVYENSKQVFSINGFMFPIDFSEDDDTFLSPVATSSWGWATWADRWNLFESDPGFIDAIGNNALLKNRFNIGNDNKFYMLQNMHTWDIRWYYTAFVRNGLGLFPTKSLVKNIGFDGSGTHRGNEGLTQQAHMLPIEVYYKDSIDLVCYSKLLAYNDAETPTLKQKIKNKVKRFFFSSK